MQYLMCILVCQYKQASFFDFIFCSRKSPLFKRAAKRCQSALKRQNTATLAAAFVVGVSAFNVFAIAANGQAPLPLLFASCFEAFGRQSFGAFNQVFSHCGKAWHLIRFALFETYPLSA
jgi:hypothetical protein